MLQRAPTSKGQTLHRNRYTVCWLADANSWKGQDVRTLQFATILGFWSTNSQFAMRHGNNCELVNAVPLDSIDQFTAITQQAELEQGNARRVNSMQHWPNYVLSGINAPGCTRSAD